MLVPVIAVIVVAVAVVEKVHVVAVLDRLVTAARSVLVVAMVGVLGVDALALVPVAVVLTMDVAVVEVVDVVAVYDRCMTAIGDVLMLMILVKGVRGARVDSARDEPYGSGVPEPLVDSRTRDRAAVDGLDRIGLALADPIRCEILVRLLHETQTPSELAYAIGTSRSNLSNHLACLRGCGLITSEKDGRHLHYQLASHEFGGALRALLSVAETLKPCNADDNSATATGSRS